MAKMCSGVERSLNPKICAFDAIKGKLMILMDKLAMYHFHQKI